MDSKYSLKRVYGESATRTSMFPNISSKRQSEMSPTPTVDRTNLDFVNAVLEIAKVVGPRTFISFIDAWDKDVPPLSTNPKAAFNTPHGVYGYPLTEENFVKFIQTGHPTGATFATNRKFFHVYRINPSSERGAVEIQKSFETNAYRNANNLQEARKDIRELIRLEYLHKRDRLRYTPKSEYDPSIDVRDYMSIDWLLPRGLPKTSKLLSAFKVLNKHYQDLISREDDDVASEALREEYKEEVEIFYEFATNIFFEASMSPKHNYKQNLNAIKNKSPGYLFFVVYYAALSLAPGSRRGAGSAAFSNYLYSIGIKSLIDRGTGTIHPSEPSQAFVINQGPVNNYELIGTYKNELASLSGEDKKNKQTEAIVAVINDTSNNINTTTTRDPDSKKDNFPALGVEDFEKFYCKAFKEFDEESYHQMVEDISNISSDQPLSSNPSSCLESMLKFSLSSEEIPDYMKIGHKSFMPVALGFELPNKNTEGEKYNKYENQKVNTADFFAEYIYCIFRKEIDFAISSESDIRDLIKFIKGSNSLFDNLLILYQVYNEDSIENVRKNNAGFSLKSYRKNIKVFCKENNSNTNTTDLLKTESLLSNIFFESYCLLCMFFCKNDFIVQECKDFVIKNVLRNPKAKPKDFFELIKTTKIELYTSSAITSQFTKNLKNYNKYLSLSIDSLSPKNNMLDYAQLLVSCSSTIYSLHEVSTIEKPNSDADANDFYVCLLETFSLYLEFLKKFNVEYEKLSYSASPDEVIKATKFLKTSCKRYSPLNNLTGKTRDSIFTRPFIDMTKNGTLSEEQAVKLNSIGKEIIFLLFNSVVKKHQPGCIEGQNLDAFELDIIQTLDRKIDTALKIANSDDDIDKFFSVFEEICNLKNFNSRFKFLHSKDIFTFEKYKIKKVDENMMSESDLLKISSIRKKFSNLCHLANNRINDENLSNHEKALYKVYLLPALHRLGDIHSSLDNNPSLYDSSLEEMRDNIHKDLNDLLIDETNKKFLSNKDKLKLSTTEDGIPVFSHKNYMYTNKNLLKTYLEKIISGKIQKIRGFDAHYHKVFPLLSIEDHEDIFSLFMTTFLQKSSVTEKINCIETITDLMPSVSYYKKNHLQFNIDKRLFSNMLCDIINNRAIYIHIPAYGFVVNLIKIIPYIFSQKDAAYIISNMHQTDLAQSKSFDKEIVKLEKRINILKVYNESFNLNLRKFIRLMLS